MDQRLHFVTVATVDLDAARRFSTDGLGWTPLFDAPGEIIFYQVAPGAVLGLFDAAKFDQDLGGEPTTRAVSGLTLAHNVDTRDAVTTTMTAIRSRIAVIDRGFAGRQEAQHRGQRCGAALGGLFTIEGCFCQAPVESGAGAVR